MSEQSEPPIQDNRASDNDRAAYFMNEFFFSMLPCYVFIATAVVRYFRVKDKAIVHNVYIFEDALMSYKVKVRLSQFTAITYAVSLVLGVASSPLLYWGAKFGLSNLCYIFGIVAWLGSVELLKFEYVREQNQALYGHRVFWIFSFCFSVMRLFQDYMALFNIIISAARSVASIVLAMYAMYKPFDKPFQDLEEDTPSFARIFFEKFESNPLIAKILGYTIVERSKQSSFHEPLMGDIEMVDRPNGVQEIFANVGGDYNITQSNINLQNQLLNHLPKRIVNVSKKAEKRIEEGQQKIYYTVITTIGGNAPYRVSKRYNEFMDIYKEVKSIYDPQIYTKLDKQFPVLEKIDFSDKDNEFKRIESIQNWLNKIFDYPLFMHPILLEFLSIDKDLQQPFIVYFLHVSKMKGNKNPVLNKMNKSEDSPSKINNYNNINNDQNYSEFVDKYAPIYQQQQGDYLRTTSTHQFLLDSETIIASRKNDFHFEAVCKNSEKSQFGNTLQYCFDISFTPKNGQKQRWTISKTMTEVMELNKEMQNTLKIPVKYYSSISDVWKIKDSNKKQDVQDKINAMNQYLSSVLKQKGLYCKALFDFIEFDPQKEIHYNSRMCTPRQTILSNENEEIIAQGSNTLSNYQGITDEREPGLKTQVNSGLKGVNLLKEFNLQGKADNERNQLILDQRDNSIERFINGVNLNRVIISVQKIMTKQIQSTFKNETRLITQYLIYLEEYDSYGTIAKQIKLLKGYNSIKELDKNIKHVYGNVNIKSPTIPSDRTPSNQFIADEMKKEFDIYFEGILKLSFIEQNSSFENFFRLRELNTMRKVSYSGTVQFDFTQEEDY